jgi:hypothetical protein
MFVKKKIGEMNRIEFKKSESDSKINLLLSEIFTHLKM